MFNTLKEMLFDNQVAVIDIKHSDKYLQVYVLNDTRGTRITAKVIRAYFKEKGIEDQYDLDDRIVQKLTKYEDAEYTTEGVRLFMIPLTTAERFIRRWRD